MNRDSDLISLLVDIFSLVARARMLDGKNFSDSRSVTATPGMFYRGGLPVHPGHSLAFARAQRQNASYPVFFIANARTDAQTEAITDLSNAVIQ